MGQLSMKMKLALALLVACCAAPAARAAEYRTEAVEAAPPMEVVKAIAEQLAGTAIKVVQGEKRVVCEIWFCKQWPVQAGFKQTAQVLYPFEPGQLIGVLRFPRKGSDFRDQPIPKGVYTLRYAQQPIDGNHVGTSPTRDFLVLVGADQDTATKPIAAKELQKLSAAAAGSGHPAMLCLQRTAEAPAAFPALQHSPKQDWWILQVQGKGAVGDKSEPLAVDVIVVGKAGE